MSKQSLFILTIVTLLSIGTGFCRSQADTLFLLKETNHSIFIDTSGKSEFSNIISDFGFDQFDSASYTESLQYLKQKGLPLTKRFISGLPKKWILLKFYRNNYYAYSPSDFYTHLKVSITDTAFIDYSGEGASASKILRYEHPDHKTFSFSLRSMGPARKLVIHLVDQEKGIAVFEDNRYGHEKYFYLMADASKIRGFPIIVNYSETDKQSEFDFDTPDFAKLLRTK